MVVLQCDHSSKNFYYGSVVHTVYMVSGWLKYLNVHNSCTLCPMLFNPWYVFGPRASLYHNPCLMFVAIQKPEIQLVSDRLLPNPARPTYNAWNYHGLVNFFLILGHVVSISLSYALDFIFNWRYIVSKIIHSLWKPIITESAIVLMQNRGLHANGAERFAP